MVKKSKNFRYGKLQSSSPRLVGEDIFVLLERMGGSPRPAGLLLLQRNWNKVAEELALEASLKGHKNSILILEVENSIQMQELHMRSSEILDRVNAFLDEGYFETIRIGLKNGYFPKH